MSDLSAVNNLDSMAEKYADMIYRISYHYLKKISDAEDVTQEVFIKVIEKQPVFNDDAHQKAWLIRVTINLCKDKLRSYWLKNIIPFDERDENTSSYNDTYDDGTGIMDSILKMPPKYRIVLYLHYCQNYTINEISKLLKTNPNTINSRLTRAREKLKIELTAQEAYI